MLKFKFTPYQIIDLVPVRLAAVALVLTILAAVCTPVSADNPPVPTRAIDFELKDQYNQTSTYRFPRQKVTVLVFGDRKGSEQIEGWSRPLWDRYRERIDQKGVAVLDSVPSFMRGVVRAIFKSQVKYSVLLDWTGDISKSYGYQSGRANLILIDRQGAIVLRILGAAGSQSFQQLCQKIDEVLAAS